MALRRQVKNVVRNFSDIEVKVREATSNDPWGPSSSLTSEIADATYNVQAFAEIMTLLWKRINDHGKNWRHVYKSLVVLDYIVKTGSERVASQCRENIFAIKTLKDFQFIDKDGKDQGINVREKSKQLVTLLKDDERLKSERQRALKAKERFSQSQGGIGNTSFPKNKKFQGPMKYSETGGSVDDTNVPSKNWQEHDKSDTQSTDGRIDSDFEKVRPSNEAEEEMQLQIALAMSREEADVPEGELATPSLISTDAFQPQQPQASKHVQFDPWGQPSQPTDPWGGPTSEPVGNVDLGALSLSSNDPWGAPPKSEPVSSIGMMNQPPVSSLGALSLQSSDPWGSAPPQQPLADPWGGPSITAPPPDPWSGQQTYTSQKVEDPFAAPLSNIQLDNSSSFGISSSSQGNFMGDPMLPMSSSASATSTHSFLSNGAHLVDVDNILSEADSKTNAVNANPFALTTSSTNPFEQDKPKPKSMNELKFEKTSFATPGPSGDVLLPTPLLPSAQSNTNQTNSYNPFL